MPQDSFTPSNAISLHDAMMRVGRETVAGWDADAVAMLREVFASTPHRWVDLPLINERWPDRTKMPEELAQLIAAVWGPGGGESGTPSAEEYQAAVWVPGGGESETPSAEEYQAAVETAAARWPNAQTPAKAQLETVGKHMRQWIGDGAIKLFRYAADGKEIALGAELARAANQTTFDAMLLDGDAAATEKEWASWAERRERPEITRKIWVRIAELDALLPKVEPAQTVRELAGKRPKRKTLVESIAVLIRKIWPDGEPDGLKAGERNNIILNEMKKAGMSSAGLRTIGKAVKLAKLRNA